ncbi:hypothetical protein D3C86_1884360 [compost metagenome]
MGHRNGQSVFRDQQRSAEGVIRLLHPVQLTQKSQPYRAGVTEVVPLLPLIDQRIQVGLHRLERLAEHGPGQQGNLRQQHIKRVIDPRNDGEMDNVKRGVQPSIIRDAVA